MEQLFQKSRILIAPLGLVWPFILVPIWQELLFRYLPYRIFYLSSGKFWLIAIVSSLAFTSIHWLAKSWFIVFSFLGGLLLWWVMVKFGLIAAILLHSLINIAIWLFGLKDAIVK